MDLEIVCIWTNSYSATGSRLKWAAKKTKKIKICLIVNNTVIKQQVNYLDYWLAEIFSRWIQQGDLKRSRQDWRERDWCALNTTTTQYKGAVQHTSIVSFTPCLYALAHRHCLLQNGRCRIFQTDFAAHPCFFCSLPPKHGEWPTTAIWPYGHTAGPCHMTTTQWSEVL